MFQAGFYSETIRELSHFSNFPASNDPLMPDPVSITEVSNYVVSKAEFNKAVGHDYLPYEVWKILSPVYYFLSYSVLFLTMVTLLLFGNGHW